MAGVRAEQTVATREAMHELGTRVAAVLRPGDLVVLTGDLGAGKTTLTQGLGEGLGVRGPVTSPTFVIARVHPSLRGGPALVHVDAYRLGSIAEVDDLDLDASLEESVTVVEWGEGLVDDLTTDRLHVAITRPRGASVPGEDGDPALGPMGEQDEPDDAPAEPRTVTVVGEGARWEGVELPEAPMAEERDEPEADGREGDEPERDERGA
jgi:tRNA threonylcarbamoyladenosine biosynthesis protein TsaE